MTLTAGSCAKQTWAQMYKHLRQERFLQLLSRGFAEPPCYSCFVLFSLPEKDLSSLEETRLLGGRQRVFCLELAAVVSLALLFTPLDKHGFLPCSPRSCWFCEFSVCIGAERHQFRIQEQSGMGLIYLSLGEKEDNARIMSQRTPKSEEGRLTEGSPWPFYAYMHMCMYI